LADVTRQRAAERALTRLHEIGGEEDLQFSSRIDRVLALGREYFGTDVGLVNRIGENSLLIEYANGPESEALVQTIHPLGGMERNLQQSSNKFVVCDNVTDSLAGDHAFYRKIGIESYIESPIFVDGGRYGTLAFAATKSRGSPFELADGGILRTFAQWLGLEISRTRAQAALQETSDQLADAVESLPDGFVLFDAAEKMLLCNAKFREMWEPAIAERIVPGITLVDLLDWIVEAGAYENEKDETHAAFGRNRLARMRAATGRPEVMRLTDGRWFHFSERRTRAGGFVGIRTDISDVMEAENLLRRSEEQVRAVFENLVDGIVTIDERGRIERANPAVERIFGYTPQELAGRNVSVLMPPDTANMHDTFLSNYMAGGEAKIIGKGRELIGRRKDGSEFPLYLAVGEMFHGDRRAFTGIPRDVSEEHRARREIEAAMELAENANLAKSDFLSAMSHELRTPMNAILGFGQLLDEDPRAPLKGDQTRFVAQILKNGDHLLKLIDEVLDLSKVESGNIVINSEIVAPTDVLEACVLAAESLAREDGITVIDETDTVPLPLLEVDPVRMKQVLLNLISNAVKYNRPEGSVTLTAEIRDDVLRISVADTGYGIPEERWGDIFVPFNRLDAGQSNIEGTGIGLTLAKRLVEYMSGRIGFDSAIDRGTTFWVDFPCARGPVIDVGSIESEEAAASSSDVANGGGPGRKVLYIEDNPANLELMQEIVARIPNLEMLSAHTAEIGVKLARDLRPDVVLMDINLPGMDGYEGLAALKNDPETAGVPVVALTANAMPADIKRGRAAGFAGYLTKPIRIREVTAALVEALATD